MIFIAPEPGQKGGFISPEIVKEFIQGRAIIHFPESIYDWSKDEQMKINLHEIAHFHLNHKDGLTHEKSIEEFHRQEKEAWEQVDKWRS